MKKEEKKAAVKLDGVQLFQNKRHKEQVKKVLQTFADAYKNMRRGKRKADLYEDDPYTPHPSWNELRQLGRKSWIVQRACKAIPDDATKNWIDITDSESKNDTDLKKVKDLMTKFDLRGKLAEAGFQSELQGGAAIFLGVLDGTKGANAEPLVVKKVTSLEALTVISMLWIRGESPYSTNPMSPFYGKPEKFRLTDIMENPTGGTEIKASDQVFHCTRFMLFNGLVVDRIHRMERWGFGDSRVYAMQEALKSFGIVTAGVEDIFLDFATKILTIEGMLEKLMTPSGRNDLSERLNFLNETTSNDGLLVLGEHEKYDKVTHNVSGMKDFIGFVIDLVAGAADIPKTKLFGQQLGTLSGAEETGEDYDNRVERYQDTVLRPHIETFLDIAYPVATGKPRPATLQWQFNPLEKPNTKEQVEIQSLASQTVINLYNAYLINEEEARTVLSSKSENWMLNVDPKVVIEKPEVNPPVNPPLKGAPAGVVPQLQNIEKPEAEATPNEKPGKKSKTTA